MVVTVICHCNLDHFLRRGHLIPSPLRFNQGSSSERGLVNIPKKVPRIMNELPHIIKKAPYVVEILSRRMQQTPHIKKKAPPMIQMHRIE